MGTSDKPYFLERVKKTPMSRVEIQDTFNVSRGTAINWSNAPQVIHLEGTYPKMYAHEEYLTLGAKRPVVKAEKPPEPSPGKEYLELPNVPTDQKSHALEKVLASTDDNPTFSDLNKMFVEADSPVKCDQIEQMLVSAIVLNRYNRQLLTE